MLQIPIRIDYKQGHETVSKVVVKRTNTIKPIYCDYKNQFNLFYYNNKSLFICLLADALLADLQNSVPGQPAQQPPRHHNYSPVNSNSGAQNGSSPGYGSVRPKQQAVSPASVNKPRVLSLKWRQFLSLASLIMWGDP